MWIGKDIKLNRIIIVFGVFAVLSGTLLLSSGCASVSLFSSDEKHYHRDTELEKRVKKLEQRLNALECQKKSDKSLSKCKK